MPDSPLHPPSRPKSRSNPQVDSLPEALGVLKQDRCTWAATALLEIVPHWPGAANALSRDPKRSIPRLSGMGITVRITHIGGRSHITLRRDTPSDAPTNGKKMSPPISTISTISTARPGRATSPHRRLSACIGGSIAFMNLAIVAGASYFAKQARWCMMKPYQDSNTDILLIRGLQ